MAADPRDPVLLGTWPTPVEAVPRLAEAIGLEPGDLWLKRDDLGGLGAGGNKVRKLEHLCARAIAEGADVLVTTGAAQSNHARLTAAAAARLGLGVVLVLRGSPGPAVGNLLLDELLGARIVWAGDVDDDGLDAAAARAAEDVRAEGGVPSLLPYGGSDRVGARGYVTAGEELRAQVPGLAHVAVAVGSGGTMAGLAAALGPGAVLGVDTGATADGRARTAGLLAALLADDPGLPAAAGPTDAGALEGELRLRADQVGEGYSTLAPGARHALALAARTEGVVLDPIYTARALAGLIAAVRDGDVRPGRPTVLLHSGGVPGLFAHPSDALRAG
jgi:D-cysteine desulfhydrase